MKSNIKRSISIGIFLFSCFQLFSQNFQIVGYQLSIFEGNHLYDVPNSFEPKDVVRPFDFIQSRRSINNTIPGPFRVTREIYFSDDQTIDSTDLILVREVENIDDFPFFFGKNYKIDCKNYPLKGDLFDDGERYIIDRLHVFSEENEREFEDIQSTLKSFWKHPEKHLFRIWGARSGNNTVMVGDTAFRNIAIENPRNFTTPKETVDWSFYLTQERRFTAETSVYLRTESIKYPEERTAIFPSYTTVDTIFPGEVKVIENYPIILPEDSIPAGLYSIYIVPSEHNPESFPCLAFDSAGSINYVTSTSSTTNLDENLVIISPNPTSDFININHEDLEIDKIHLMNTSGEILKYYDQNTNKLDISNLPPSIYIVRIYTNEGVYLRKILRI